MSEIILVLLLILGPPLAFLVWLTVKLLRTTSGLHDVQDRLRSMEMEVRSLRREGEAKPPAAPAPVTTVAPALVAPPPVVARPVRIAEPVTTAPRKPVPVAPPKPPPAPRLPSINWEQFMGVKLFAWIGGLALFLGVAFFVKYSFENNLISPEVRVALGYVCGAGLLIGGLALARKSYPVLGQTLCATGVLVLYAVTFAAHAFYHFLGVLPAFALMVLVTAVAFLLAVRLDAQVVAILGLLGGFLTPVLLSTGKDNPLGLFSYIALLDAGLIAVVTRKRWNHLVLLAAVGTVLMQAAWVVMFFAVSKVSVAMSVFLGFEVLFLIAFALTDRKNVWITASAIGMAFAPLVFTLYLLTFRQLGARPGVIFTFILVADLGLLALVLLRSSLAYAHLAAGGAAFVLLGIWTAAYVSDGLLNWALGFFLVFAILHAVFPVVLQRLRPEAAPMWWGHLFPPVALLLLMIPILRLPELSWLVWLCVLALDVVVFALALVTASVLAILGALVLTLAATALWIFKVPATVGGVPDLLVVIGGFALVFFAIGIFAARRLAPKTAGVSPAVPQMPWLPALTGDLRAQIPAFSAVLPFILLMMVVLRMPLSNPSPVFGLAMLLVILLLGVARWTKVDMLAAVGLVSAAALEYAWHNQRFNPDFAVVPLVWYLAFVAVFTVFPFAFRKEMESRVVPWAVAALAGPVHFTLVYRLVKATWSNPMMGLLPAAFAIPPLVGLIVLLGSKSERRLSQLAWFGGATLFFVTLIFPIQFERQWITIGWALEGVALLWLYHRVPHNGLRWVGIALLCVAFARLALNPAVMAYHPRSATPIFNWYLYSYGIVAACLFVAAKLVDDGAPGGRALPATLGTILAFLLLNIEIADYFTPAGSRSLIFQFSGNFARDMTYSIAWALFALVLLLAGIAKKLPAARYASLALLGVTLLKLFFHDLGRLSQLYRIGAFISVAVILLFASFLYQRFIAADQKAK